MKTVRTKCFSSTIERGHTRSQNAENTGMCSPQPQKNVRAINIKTQENDISAALRAQKPIKTVDIFSADSKSHRLKSDSQVNIKVLPPIPAYLFPNLNQKKAYAVNVKTSAYSYKIKFGQDVTNMTQRIFSPICPNQVTSARDNSLNTTQNKITVSAVSSQSQIKDADPSFELISRYEHLSILKKRKSKRPNSEVSQKLNYFIKASHSNEVSNPLEKRRRMLNCSQDSPSIENSLLERHVKVKTQESFQRYKHCSSSPVKRDPSITYIEPPSPEYKHARTMSMREPYVSKFKYEPKVKKEEELDNTLKLSFEKEKNEILHSKHEQDDINYTQSDANDLNEYMDMRKNTPLDKIDFSRRF